MCSEVPAEQNLTYTSQQRIMYIQDTGTCYAHDRERDTSVPKWYVGQLRIAWQRNTHLATERVKKLYTRVNVRFDMQVLNELFPTKSIHLQGNEEDPKSSIMAYKKCRQFIWQPYEARVRYFTRGTIRSTWRPFHALMTNICKNLQAFDATNDRQQRRGRRTRSKP
jgi:hypothetical protein